VSAPVDVLAVMEAMTVWARLRADPEWADKADEARNAVASLVIAARHLHIITAGLERNIDVNERAAVAAALARVGGAA